MKHWLLLGVFSVLCSCTNDKAAKDSQRKVKMLYEALAVYNKAQAQENGNTVRKVHDVLDRSRYNDEVARRILASCDSIHNKTKKLLQFLGATRVQLRVDATTETSRSAASIMLGENERGLAYKLLKKVAVYDDAIHRIDSEQASLQLIPGSLDKTSQIDKAAEFYFADASLTNAFAALSQIESRILAFEKEALQLQQLRIGCGGNITTSSIGAFAGAESNIVAAGTIYKAEMFLTTALEPKPAVMLVNGQPIPIDESGRGKVSFLVQKIGPDQQDSVARKWLGVIKTNGGGLSRDGSQVVLVDADFDSRRVHVQRFAEGAGFAHQYAATLTQGAI